MSFREKCPRLALVSLLLAQACGPCLGVMECRDGPHVAVEGQVLVGETGVPVRDAKLTLIAHLAGGGVDSTETSTHSDGTFGMSLAPQAEAVQKVSLHVVPLGYGGYVVDSLPCREVEIRGDACILEPIVPAPWVPIHALLSYRNSENVRATNVPVRFDRTSGAEWAGPQASTPFQTQTDGAGIATLFPEGLYATALDTIVGDLIVDLPAPFGRSIRHGYVVRPIYKFAERPLDIVGVGPNIDFVLTFIDSATTQPLSSVSVQFLPTSGIALEPATLQVVSDANGTARLIARPLATGTVTGDLVIRPRSSGPSTTLAPYALTTFDSDTTRVAGRWKVGGTGVLYAIPGPSRP